MTTLPTGNMATILEKFPCLEEGQYVLAEFFDILKPGDPGAAQKKIKSVMEELLRKVKCQTNFSPEETDEKPAVMLIKALEKRLRYKECGVEKSQTLVQLHEVEDLTKEEALLESKAASPSHLVVIMKHNVLDLCYVLGDQVQINCQSGVLDSLVVLLGTYYVYDLDYPSTKHTPTTRPQKNLRVDKGTSVNNYTKR